MTLPLFLEYSLVRNWGGCVEFRFLALCDFTLTDLVLAS